MDCHVHWHATAEAYMEPESFRLNLNALIQDLRNVTFLLQKQKHELPSFDTWYPAWQDTVKDDQVMRWVVSARNRIVKESDLEIHSTALMRLSIDWRNEIEKIYEVPPRFTTHEIVSALLAKPAPLNRGVVTIERRWVDVLLPSWELLNAALHAYNRLVEVIREAHDATNASTCELATRRPECVGPKLEEQPYCMNQIDDSRRLHVEISTMTRLTEEIKILRSGDIPAEATRARYGDMKTYGDAIQRVPHATDMAKRMLAIDKELATAAWLLRNNRIVDIFAMIVPDQDSKRVQMNHLADRVERADADGVVFIGESWYGLPASDGGIGDRDRKLSPKNRDRSECIWVVGITRDGRTAECITVFSRGKDGKILFGPSTMIPGGSVNMMLPVIRRWDQMKFREQKTRRKLRW
jgi:hypothetical protein